MKLPSTVNLLGLFCCCLSQGRRSYLQRSGTLYDQNFDQIHFKSISYLRIQPDGLFLFF